MRALCWMGRHDLQVNTVPEPRIVNAHDVVLKVRFTTTCGSDLHLIDGYISTMREADVIGHEYMGEIVEVGAEATKFKVGERVVVPSFLGCGTRWYCEHELWSLCDNTHPIGSVETIVPVRALFDPVGSTATLVVERFHQNGMEPSRLTAILLWSSTSSARCGSRRASSAARCSRPRPTSAALPPRTSSRATQSTTRRATAGPCASPRSRRSATRS